MKTKDVLELWCGWDSPDIFEVREVSPSGKRVSSRNMTGLELVESPFGERELKRFGSFGKQPDGTWWHYVDVASDC